MLTEYPVKTLALSNGETLAYREAGSGELVLLLVHGNMSSSAHYDTLMEELEGKFKIYAVDLRGFGDSTYNKPIDSLADFAQDIALFMQSLGITADCAVGWSTGGGVVLELAAEEPELVKKVVLVESVGVVGYPMFKKGPDGQPILTERITTREEVAADPVQVIPILQAYETGNREMLRAVWNMLIYNKVQPEAPRYERYVDAMLKQRNLIDVDYALIHFNMTHESNGVATGSGRLDLVKGPALVIQGEDDMVVPKVYAEQTAELLGSRANLVMLPGVGHSPFTDDLDKMAGLIREFAGQD